MKFEILIPIILAPVITAIVGLVFSKYGISGKSKRIEYYLKRLELIEKLLANNDITASKNLIRNELNDIVTYLSLSSLKNDEFVRIEFKNRPWFRKILTLPYTGSIGGTIAQIF